jgi:hypothetical protein
MLAVVRLQALRLNRCPRYPPKRSAVVWRPRLSLPRSVARVLTKSSRCRPKRNQTRKQACSTPSSSARCPAGRCPVERGLELVNLSYCTAGPVHDERRLLTPRNHHTSSAHDGAGHSGAQQLPRAEKMSCTNSSRHIRISFKCFDHAGYHSAGKDSFSAATYSIRPVFVSHDGRASA